MVSCEFYISSTFELLYEPLNNVDCTISESTQYVWSKTRKLPVGLHFDLNSPEIHLWVRALRTRYRELELEKMEFWKFTYPFHGQQKWLSWLGSRSACLVSSICQVQTASRRRMVIDRNACVFPTDHIFPNIYNFGWSERLCSTYQFRMLVFYHLFPEHFITEMKREKSFIEKKIFSCTKALRFS